MTSPRISTYRQVVPYIYSWRTPDIPKYDGWEKIGYTEQESAEKRISQQASQLNIVKIKVWAYRATFMTEGRWDVPRQRLPRLPQAARNPARVRPQRHSAPYGVARVRRRRENQQGVLLRLRFQVLHHPDRGVAG